MNISNNPPLDSVEETAVERQKAISTLLTKPGASELLESIMQNLQGVKYEPVEKTIAVVEAPVTGLTEMSLSPQKPEEKVGLNPFKVAAYIKGKLLGSPDTAEKLPPIEKQDIAFNGSISAPPTNEIQTVTEYSGFKELPHADKGVSIMLDPSWRQDDGASPLPKVVSAPVVIPTNKNER